MEEPAFDTYSLVVMRRPTDAPSFSDEELERLQEQHLAHLRRMREQGHLVAAGPFSDQPDESWRGLCLYRTGLEQTRELAESDPSVQARRMAVDVLTWWVPAGELCPQDPPGSSRT